MKFLDSLFLEIVKRYEDLEKRYPSRIPNS
jgi:hypothetical protein